MVRTLLRYDSNYLTFHLSFSQLGKTGIFLPMAVLEVGLLLEDFEFANRCTHKSQLKPLF